MVKVRQRKRDIVESFRSGSERRITDTPGLDLLMGEAHFNGSKTLAVQLNDGTASHPERGTDHHQHRGRVQPHSAGPRDGARLNSTTHHGA